MTAGPDRIKHLELLNEELVRRETQQADELIGLDSKATTVWSANGVVLGLVFNAASSFAGEPPVIYVVFLASLGVLGVGLVTGIRTLWTVSRQVVPKPATLVAKYHSATLETTLLTLIGTRAKGFEVNRPLARQKDFRLKVQMVLLSVGGLGILSAFLLQQVPA